MKALVIFIVVLLATWGYVLYWVIWFALLFIVKSIYEEVTEETKRKEDDGIYYWVRR